MTHTPAPWKVKGTAPSLKVTANGFTVATIIATSKANSETKEANARLIAAAPELYALVRAYVTTYPLDEYAQKALAAISKVEGTS